MNFYKETDFQESIIGKYPKDWTIARIDEKFDTSSGGTPDRQRKEYYKGTIPWVKSGELKDKVIIGTEEKITEEGFKNSAAKLFPKGTLLVAMYGATVGKTGILGIDATTNQAVCALLPKEKDVDINYFQHSLVSIRNRWIFQSAGGAQPNISQDIIRSSRIPFPPFKEQQQIARVLGVVDCAIELADRVIAQTERLKRGLMQQLLTHGIGHTETKQTPIGQIPEKWTIVKLADIARVERGKFAHRPRNEPRFYGGKYPFIQTGDIASAKGLIKTYTQTLNEEGLEISRMFKKGTIVISIAGNIGDVGMLDFDACFPDSVIGITPCGEVDSFFLMYLLQYLQHDISAKAPRSTQKNINLDIIKPIKIPLPPLSEQQKISSILTEIGKKLEIEVNQKAKLENIKRGLMDLLLTGKVRIKVD